MIKYKMKWRDKSGEIRTAVFTTKQALMQRKNYMDRIGHGYVWSESK